MGNGMPSAWGLSLPETDWCMHPRIPRIYPWECQPPNAIGFSGKAYGSATNMNKKLMSFLETLYPTY